MAYGFNNREYVVESSIKANGGHFSFDFCCPLCSTIQTAQLDIVQLACGTALHCVNKTLCGDENFCMHFEGVPLILADSDEANRVDMAIVDDLGGSLELRLSNGDSCRTPLQDINWGRGTCGSSRGEKLRLDEPFTNATL